MKDKRKTMRAVLVWVVTLIGVAAPVAGWVWFGYEPGRSEWKITPATITLAEPRAATQLHVREFMPDIGQYGGDLTAQSVFWTDNPEWSVTPGGVLSCRVSGPGVVHARLPDGRQLTQTIHVDPHLPPRILVPPYLPLLPSPARELVYIDTRDFVRHWWDDLVPFRTNSVSADGTLHRYDDVAATVGHRSTNLALRLLAYALQGLVNREQPRIITYGGTSALGIEADYWEEWIVSNGFRITDRVLLRDVPATLAAFTNASQISGFLLYPAHVYTNTALADLLCWVIAACGATNVLPVTPEVYAMIPPAVTSQWPVMLHLDDAWLHAAGLTNRAAIYADSYARWWPACSHRAIAHMHPWIRTDNRDYWIAARIWPFAWRSDASDAEANLFERLLRDELPVHAPILGGVGQFQWEIDRYCSRYSVVSNTVTGVVTRRYLEDTNFPVILKLSNGSVVSAPHGAALPVASYTMALGPNEVILTSGYGVTEPVYFEKFTAWQQDNVEWAWWKKTSAVGKTITYTYVPNWSFYAGMRWEQMTNDLVAALGGLRRPAQPASAVTGPYIYVCGWMADGDNTMFDTYTWPRYWRDPLSATLPWSYGIPLMMYDAAPLQMKWFHMHETAVRRIDAEAGVSEIWSAAYGSAYGQHQALLADYLRLSDEYLARSGLRMIRPQLRVGRAEYEAYSQMQHAEGLGGNYENTPGGWDIELRPTNMAGKVWLLHPDRLRLAEEWRQQFLIRTPAEQNQRPQYHSVWCWNQFTPATWAQWVDVQTNWPPDHETHYWRHETPLKIVPPETMLEMMR